MNNQKVLWDRAHKESALDHHSTTPTDFAEKVLKLVKPGSKILELGCGVGNDSIAFANAGYTVVATDFSKEAIEKDRKRLNNTNLKFEVLDMNSTFEFEDHTFDVVYARLSLHYFTDEITRKIFSEIHRILKPGGLLCFICKSTNDPLYGKGEKVEADMYEYHGHVRHFFSESYTKSLLINGFEPLKIESGEKKFYDKKSAFIRVIAKAI